VERVPPLDAPLPCWGNSQAIFGNLSQQQTIQLAQPLKMKWCVDCHKQQNAAVIYTVCHALGNKLEQQKWPSQERSALPPRERGS